MQRDWGFHLLLYLWLLTPCLSLWPCGAEHFLPIHWEERQGSNTYLQVHFSFVNGLNGARNNISCRCQNARLPSIDDWRDIDVSIKQPKLTCRVRFIEELKRPVTCPYEYLLSSYRTGGMSRLIEVSLSLSSLKGCQVLSRPFEWMIGVSSVLSQLMGLVVCQHIYETVGTINRILINLLIFIL